MRLLTSAGWLMRKMNRDGAEAHETVTGFAEARGAKHPSELVSVGMGAERLVEIAIGRIVPPHQDPQQRHPRCDIEPEEPMKRPAWRREVEARKSAARLQHTA